MRVVVTRVLEASVAVEGEIISQIGRGLLVLVGFGKEDAPAPASTAETSTSTQSLPFSDAEMRWMSTKLLNTNFWPDEKTLWGRTIGDINGDILVVSQFTLFGILNKGKKPTFHKSLEPVLAESMYNHFLGLLQQQHSGGRVLGGRFGASMAVQSINDGPVTFTMDSRDRSK
jgi:D-tyrosyl-tRNA(Tyr) deacylase